MEFLTIIIIIIGVIAASPFLIALVYKLIDNDNYKIDSDAIESHFGCSRSDWYSTIEIQEICPYCGTKHKKYAQCNGCGYVSDGGLL